MGFLLHQLLLIFGILTQAYPTYIKILGTYEEDIVIEFLISVP
jgi:hypothetical protein